jgi:hypothetical protein
MFDAGLTWFNEEEMRSKFEAMDIDNSGKLNLAEVFSASSRMQWLVEKAREYERQEIAKGRKLTQVEVMEEFSMMLLIGDDLAKLPHVTTRVSSGDITSKWAHLDCKAGAWLPNESDLDKWIEWDFQSPATITTISTCGHPHGQSWVTKYQLFYWEERRFDPMHDDEPVTFFQMRRELAHENMDDRELKAHWEGLSPEEAPEDPFFPNDLPKGAGAGHWVPYTYLEQQLEFNANTDEEVVENVLEPPIEATYVRLQILNWQKQATLRATLTGYCRDEDDHSLSGTGAVPVPSRPLRKTAPSRPGSRMVTPRV